MIIPDRMTIDRSRLMIDYSQINHLWLNIQEIFPERIANQVNRRVRMHEFVYKICKTRGYFLCRLIHIILLHL